MTRKDSSVDGIHKEIRRRILDEEFPLGQRINQIALSEELSVSRTPVVKALHMLVAEGLLDNIPNRGFFVHQITLREIIELFMLRQSLEMIAAIHVAEYGKEEDFALLEGYFQPFRNASCIDIDAYQEMDRKFHRTLLSLCDNALMHKINESMQIMERSYIVGLLRPPEETLQEHFDIIDALRSRDIIRAQDVTRMHTETTKKTLLSAAKQVRALGMDPATLPIREAIRFDT